MVKFSFYPFMKIQGTTFMWILHTMDQSWCDGDLNDDGLSFCNITIWGHEDMRTYHELTQKKLDFYNSYILDEEQKNINDFRWMNKSIAFDGSNAIEVTLSDGRISFCNIHIFEPCYAP